MLFKKKKNNFTGISLVFLRKNGKYEFVRMNNYDIPEKMDNNTYVEVPICWKKDGKEDVMHIVREGASSIVSGKDDFLFKSAPLEEIVYDGYSIVYKVSQETLDKIPGEDHIEKCRNILLHYADGMKLIQNEKGEWVSKINPIGRMALTLRDDLLSGENPYDIVFAYSEKYGFDCDKFTMMIEQVARIKYNTKSSEETIKRFGDALLDYANFLKEMYDKAKLGYEDYHSLLFKHANNPLNITEMVSPHYEEDNETLVELRRKKAVLESAKEHITPLLTDMFEDDDMERNMTEYVLDSILDEALEKNTQELDKLESKMPTQEEARKSMF